MKLIRRTNYDLAHADMNRAYDEIFNYTCLNYPKLFLLSSTPVMLEIQNIINVFTLGNHKRICAQQVLIYNWME